MTHNIKPAISCCCNKGADFTVIRLQVMRQPVELLFECRGVIHVHTHTPTHILKFEPGRGVVAINTYKQELFTHKVTYCTDSCSWFTQSCCASLHAGKRAFGDFIINISQRQPNLQLFIGKNEILTLN